MIGHINGRQGRCEEPADEGLLLALAERVEKGLDGEQHQWLAQAFYAANPAPEYGTADRSKWVARSDRFHTLLAVRAYLDAAMSLVPRWLTPTIVGHDREVRLYNGIGGTIRGNDYASVSSELSLALCAAALRARAQSGAAS